MLPNNSVFYWENKFFWICTAQARILPLVELTQSCFSYQCNNKVRCLSSCWHIKSTFFLLTVCPEGHGPWCSADFSLDKLCAVQQSEPVKAAADILNTSMFHFSKQCPHKKTCLRLRETQYVSIVKKKTYDNFKREAILKLPTQCVTQSLFYTSNNLIFQKSFWWLEFQRVVSVKKP